jgi:hypothetical protein
MLDSYKRLKIGGGDESEEEGEVVGVGARKMWPVGVCRWVMIPDKATRRSRQALVSAGIDGRVGFFL